MPWENKTVEKIRLEFIAKAMLGEESLSELCRQYQISRPTAYKWIERYRSGEGLHNRSHEPKSKPYKTPADKEQEILDVRGQHTTWGPRKIHRYLQDNGKTDLPAVSTISDILKRNNMVSIEESENHTPWKRFEMEKPNEMWQMDFKGHFVMLNDLRCYPLTILDDCSRYSLCVDAKANEQWLPTKESLIRVFYEYGLPKTFLCDNGNPWADAQKGYTQFEIWMMQMDVLTIHGRSLHPQTQGKDERFHRTLKNDLLKRIPIRDFEHAQKEFDKFRYCYNNERPHEALNLDVPAKHYTPSTRQYIENPQEPEYDLGKQLRKVNCKGYISVCKKRYYVGENFSGRYLEIVNTEENIVELCYGNFIIAKINLSEELFISKKIFRR